MRNLRRIHKKCTRFLLMFLECLEVNHHNVFKTNCQRWIQYCWPNFSYRPILWQISRNFIRIFSTFWNYLVGICLKGLEHPIEHSLVIEIMTTTPNHNWFFIFLYSPSHLLQIPSYFLRISSKFRPKRRRRGGTDFKEGSR